MPRSRPGESPPTKPSPTKPAPTKAAEDDRGEPTRAEGAPKPVRGSRSGPAARAGAVIAPGAAAKGGAAALLADDDDSLNLVEDSASVSQSQRSEPLPENERPFGRFQLLRRLAYGGMGEIFLARQGGAGSLAPVAKLVVIKRILSHMKRECLLVAVGRIVSKSSRAPTRRILVPASKDDVPANCFGPRITALK